MFWFLPATGRKEITAALEENLYVKYRANFLEDIKWSLSRADIIKGYGAMVFRERCS